jgi:hypothetical protein
MTYRGFAAIEQALAAGVPLKDFYAKNKDNDPGSYTSSIQEATLLWERGTRRFKGFIRGRFLVLDIDRKPGKADGIESLYRLFPRKTMPKALLDIPVSFPCYVTTPSGGCHLYFKYNGPELRFRELASAVEVKEFQITAPGSVKENGEYVLHGELAKAPPLYGLFLQHIENAKREREKAARRAGRPTRPGRPRITLDTLAGEAASAHAGHHNRQVSFAGRAWRCGFSAEEALAYAQANPGVFGSDPDTENTVFSMFRDNGGGS